MPTSAVASYQLQAPVGNVSRQGPVASLSLAAPVGSTVARQLNRADLVLTLALTQGDRVNSPGTLLVSVGNGPPLGIAYFYLDATVASFYSVTLDSTGSQRQVYLPIRQQVAGLHTVRVSSTTSPPVSGALANKDFTVVASNDTFVPTPVVAQEPPLVVQPNKWVFQAYDFSDINAVDTYVLPINPSTLSRSFGGITYTDEATTVSNGKIISWEGVRTPPTWIFEGSVLDKAAFREMTKWGQTGQRFYVTDHYGDRYLVKCISYVPARVRDLDRPWNHRYTMTVSVLKGVGVFV